MYRVFCAHAALQRILWTTLQRFCVQSYVDFLKFRRSYSCRRYPINNNTQTHICEYNHGCIASKAQIYDSTYIYAHSYKVCTRTLVHRINSNWSILYSGHSTIALVRFCTCTLCTNRYGNIYAVLQSTHKVIWLQNNQNYSNLYLRKVRKNGEKCRYKQNWSFSSFHLIGGKKQFYISFLYPSKYGKEHLLMFLHCIFTGFSA